MTDPDRSQPSGTGPGTRSLAVPTRRNIWPWVLLAVMTAFTVGLIGSPWLQSQVRSWFPAPMTSSQAPAGDERADDSESRMQQQELARQKLPEPGSGPGHLQKPTAVNPADDAEIAVQLRQLAAELQRMRFVVENGDAQVRDMFLLSVVRRMVEGGRPLAGMEPQLQERYGGMDGAALDALRAWSGEPQTLRTLAARLPALASAEEPAPIRADGKAVPANWWERLKSGFSGLVRLQKPASDAVPDRATAIEAAGSSLRQEDLAGAISMIGKLPRNAAGDQWLHEARLLQGAMAALDRLDGIALSRAQPALAQGPSGQTQPPVNAPQG